MDKITQVKYAADQVIVNGNFEVVDSIFSENYIAHAGDKTFKGHKFIKQFIKQVRTAIPDLKIQKVEILTESDNVVTWQRLLSGTHKVDLKGIPASNKKIKWHEIVVSRFDNDKIIEEWIVSDLALQLLLKQKPR
jgi:predicted ester cyclase